MTLVIDTHLHLYPGYDLSLALNALSRNLTSAAPGAVAMGVLVERHDCRLFAELRDGRRRLPAEAGQVQALDGGRALRVALPGREPLWLLPGRQVIARERVEVLLLGADLQVGDGLSAAETVEQGLAGGALPAIGWAPGKWFFGRKPVVRALLERFGRHELLLGDTSLRPTLWGEPQLMRAARRRGYAVVAGSDPLPLAGEERYLGCYATRLEDGAPFEPERGAEFLRSALLAEGARPIPCGRRCGALETARRVARNARAKRGR